MSHSGTESVRMFSDACAGTAAKLAAALEQMGRPEVAVQVRSLALVSQHLNGNPKQFTFGVFPVPYEKFRRMPYTDFEFIDVNLHEGGQITVEVRWDGQISGLVVTNMPDMFKELAALKGYIGSDENQTMRWSPASRG